jgi:hypothetical protein
MLRSNADATPSFSTRSIDIWRQQLSDEYKDFLMSLYGVVILRWSMISRIRGQGSVLDWLAVHWPASKTIRLLEETCCLIDSEHPHLQSGTTTGAEPKEQQETKQQEPLDLIAASLVAIAKVQRHRGRSDLDSWLAMHFDEVLDGLLEDSVMLPLSVRHFRTNKPPLAHTERDARLYKAQEWIDLIAHGWPRFWRPSESFPGSLTHEPDWWARFRAMSSRQEEVDFVKRNWSLTGLTPLGHIGPARLAYLYEQACDELKRFCNHKKAIDEHFAQRRRNLDAFREFKLLQARQAEVAEMKQRQLRQDQARVRGGVCLDERIWPTLAAAAAATVAVATRANRGAFESKRPGQRPKRPREAPMRPMYYACTHPVSPPVDPTSEDDEPDDAAFWSPMMEDNDTSGLDDGLDWGDDQDFVPGRVGLCHCSRGNCFKWCCTEWIAFVRTMHNADKVGFGYRQWHWDGLHGVGPCRWLDKRQAYEEMGIADFVKSGSLTAEDLMKSSLAHDRAEAETFLQDMNVSCPALLEWINDNRRRGSQERDEKRSERKRGFTVTLDPLITIAPPTALTELVPEPLEVWKPRETHKLLNRLQAAALDIDDCWRAMLQDPVQDSPISEERKKEWFKYINRLGDLVYVQAHSKEPLLEDDGAASWRASCSISMNALADHLIHSSIADDESHRLADSVAMPRLEWLFEHGLHPVFSLAHLAFSYFFQRHLDAEDITVASDDRQGNSKRSASGDSKRSSLRVRLPQTPAWRLPLARVDYVSPQDMRRQHVNWQSLSRSAFDAARAATSEHFSAQEVSSAKVADWFMSLGFSVFPSRAWLCSVDFYQWSVESPKRRDSMVHQLRMQSWNAIALQQSPRQLLLGRHSNTSLALKIVAHALDQDEIHNLALQMRDDSKRGKNGEASGDRNTKHGDLGTAVVACLPTSWHDGLPFVLQVVPLHKTFHLSLDELELLLRLQYFRDSRYSRAHADERQLKWWDIVGEHAAAHAAWSTRDKSFKMACPPLTWLTFVAKHAPHLLPNRVVNHDPRSWDALFGPEHFPVMIKSDDVKVHEFAFGQGWYSRPPHAETTECAEESSVPCAAVYEYVRYSSASNNRGGRAHTDVWSVAMDAENVELLQWVKSKGYPLPPCWLDFFLELDCRPASSPDLPYHEPSIAYLEWVVSALSEKCFLVDQLGVLLDGTLDWHPSNAGLVKWCAARSISLATAAGQAFVLIVDAERKDEAETLVCIKSRLRQVRRDRYRLRLKRRLDEVATQRSWSRQQYLEHEREIEDRVDALFVPRPLK